MKKYIFVNLILALIPSFICFAETIELKSGKTITGKIIEKTAQYIKVDVSGVVLIYYSDEIAKIEETPALPPASLQEAPSKKPSSENIAGEKQSFTDEEWGYSFQYPSDWEMIPGNELPKGIALGLSPKEKSFVKIFIQKGYVSEQHIKDAPTLRELIDLNFPSKEYRISQLTPLEGKMQGYLIKLLPIDDQNTKDMYSIVRPSVLKDCYFLTPLFSSQYSDKRFINITLMYTKFVSTIDNADVIVATDKESLEEIKTTQQTFAEENKKTEKYFNEAKNIIDSFNYDVERKAGFAGKGVLPLEPGKEKIPLLEKEVSSASGAATKPIPLGKIQELQDYLRKGDKYFSGKQYKEAIVEFEKALQIDPNHATTLYLLGYTYYVLGQYQTAMQYYQKVLEVAPNYGAVYIQMANIFLNLNRFEETIAYFNKALVLSPDNVEVYNGLGFAYASMGKFPEAIDAFKKALEIKIDNAEAYYGLGRVYFSSGQYIEAKENFLKAKEIFMKNGDEEGVKSMDEYLRAVP